MAVGCTSLGSFSSRFTEIVGETPTAYRRASTTRSRRCRPASRRPHPPTKPSRIGEATGGGGCLASGACPSHSIPNVTVNDVDEMLAFYREALGLEVQNDVSSVTMRWVTPAATRLRRHGALRAACEPVQFRRRRDAGAPRQGACCPIRVPLRRRRARRSSAPRRPAPMLQEPIDQGWGLRDCAFRDRRATRSASRRRRLHGLPRQRRALRTPHPGSPVLFRPSRSGRSRSLERHAEETLAHPSHGDSAGCTVRIRRAFDSGRAVVLESGEAGMSENRHPSRESFVPIWRGSRESSALLVGAVAFALGALTGIVVFWGRAVRPSPAADRSATSSRSAARSSVAAFLFGCALRSAERRNAPAASGDRPRLHWFDVAALTLAHALIALLGWAGIASC